MDLPPQRVPGSVGVRHLSASGQQYSVDLQTVGGVQSTPGTTHNFVRGQHTSPARIQVKMEQYKKASKPSQSTSNAHANCRENQLRDAYLSTSSGRLRR